MRLKILLILLVLVSELDAQRIKDLTYFKGVNSEQLIGYGIVVGLAGSGDSYRSQFTVQSVISMLKRFGITVPEANLRTRNVAAVMITSRITNLLKPGAEFDVSVSSMGDATSLKGGTLLMTPLSAKDGNVYAFSQGPVSIGGYDISTPSGSQISKNHSLSGRIPGGGLLEYELPGESILTSEIGVLLKEPDFTTANNISSAINNEYGEGSAVCLGAGEVNIFVPETYSANIPQFIADLEALEVEKDVNARVVLNERTGTVVSGNKVKILPVTITHGSLNISVSSFPFASQPNSFGEGNTVFFNNLVPRVKDEGSNSISIEGASNVQEVATALNSLNVTPRDIISIFQALKEAGALVAEVVIL
ncbi:MAG: flagellar basal body P-ring protein FlgI [Melioribacteraceae bacterium]|nr:flagellar basal body P-ring protein FlgI [Melioribacteraceae bacterium]MCF8355158.1 flagellar basal body P-ring protein FlgI [Melioribacteraceae bacterium]MCF8392487.1 flagellar basal body P-ring protein FlgI [Melioribacteraceae bacterium]MCF8418398.1 flagellar basal body P-ring protein FlgI [Melioribacteraceae bacterium]